MKIFCGKAKVHWVPGLSGSHSCVVYLEVCLGPSAHQKPLLLSWSSSHGLCCYPPWNSAAFHSLGSSGLKTQQILLPSLPPADSPNTSTWGERMANNCPFFFSLQSHTRRLLCWYIERTTSFLYLIALCKGCWEDSNISQSWDRKPIQRGFPTHWVVLNRPWKWFAYNELIPLGIRQ